MGSPEASVNFCDVRTYKTTSSSRKLRSNPPTKLSQHRDVSIFGLDTHNLKVNIVFFRSNLKFP